MNRIYIFRIFMLVVLVAFFATKIGQLNLIYHGQFYKNALEVLGSEEAANTQLLNFKIQKIVEYVFYVLIIFCSRRFFFDTINRKNTWYLSLPISIAASMIIGLLLAFLISTIDPNYYLNPYKGIIRTSTTSLFTLLFIRFSVNSFLGICLSCLIGEVEKLIAPRDKKPTFNALDLRFWVTLFALHFIVTIVITQYLVAGSSGVVLMMIPRALLVSAFFTLISYVIIDAFVENGRIRSNNLLDKISRLLITSYGVVSLFYFSLELDLSFAQIWLEVAVTPAFFFILAALLIVLLTTLAYFQFNAKKVKAALKLHENLEEKTSELSLLKSQINPHFLFNSLNTVYGLALNEESPKTAHAVQQLSEMMRFMLHENHAEKIPLQKEIDYLRNYIELQTLRISQKDHFQLKVDVAEGCQGEITPMVLISFVENAFKHGVSFQKPSWVKIKLTCNAEEVHLNVQNSVHKHAEDPEKGKSGIGLENVRKRLGILYPEKHLFQIYETEDSFEANIKITLI